MNLTNFDHFLYLMLLIFIEVLFIDLICRVKGRRIGRGESEGAESKRAREKERNVHLSFHSLNSYIGQGWVSLKLAAWNSIPASHVGLEPNHFGHLPLLFLGVLGGSWIVCEQLGLE